MLSHNIVFLSSLLFYLYIIFVCFEWALTQSWPSLNLIFAGLLTAQIKPTFIGQNEAHSSSYLVQYDNRREGHQTWPKVSLACCFGAHPDAWPSLPVAPRPCCPRMYRSRPPFYMLLLTIISKPPTMDTSLPQVTTQHARPDDHGSSLLPRAYATCSAMACLMHGQLADKCFRDPARPSSSWSIISHARQAAIRQSLGTTDQPLTHELTPSDLTETCPCLYTPPTPTSLLPHAC